MNTLKAFTFFITLLTATNTMAKGDGVLRSIQLPVMKSDTFQNPVFNPATAVSQLAELVEEAIFKELGSGNRVYEMNTHQGKYADNMFSQYRVRASVANDEKATQFDCDFELSIRVMPFAKYSGDILFYTKANAYQIVGEINSSSCQ